MTNGHPPSACNGCGTCEATLLVEGIEVAHGQYDSIVRLFDEVVGQKTSAVVANVLGRPVADGELVSIALHGATARAGHIGQATSVTDFVLATHGVVGTDAAGRRHYYTGGAGDAMLSGSIESMFVGWTFDGALTKAATLNRVNGPILGLTFGACHMPAS